ncbi:MAG: PAS domain S-box protein [Aphanothece sp. CMT-3BRIN-NPC111]|jgi:PAS domain S-box-containing protein|nr:PAS domain S-box protein [Aphanothece sp. CMT-3BRIN-NPC111]
MENPLVTAMPDLIASCPNHQILAQNKALMGIDKPLDRDAIDSSQQTVFKILLVEDNPGDARLVREMLVEEGGERFNLSYAKQLSEAFQYLSEDQFDIILLDLSLPDGQGLDTLTQTRAVSCQVPIVVLTGFKDDAIALQAVRQGAQDYLVKGEMDGKLLVRAIRYAIERNRLRMDLEARTQELQNREANFHNLIATNVDGMIVLDTNGVVRFINPAAEALFGCKAEELLGQLFSFSVVPGETRDLCIMRQSGEAPTVEMRVVETSWQGETAYLASLRDITERKWAEERQTMQFVVAHILGESTTLQEASFKILESIGKSVGWEAGEVWLLSPDSTELRLDTIWHEEASFSGANFFASSRETTFLRGQGLPGRVWSSGEPVWITDISTDINFPRATAAVKDGLYGAFAFPIRNGSEVIGVMAFYSCYIRPPDHKLLKMMADIGSQINQFIERKQAEAAIQAQKTFLSQVIDTNPNLIFVKDWNGKFTLVNKALAQLYGTTPENLIGKRDGDFNFNKQEVEQFLEADRQVMATSQELIIPEEKVTDYTGKVHCFQTIKKPLFSPDGNSYQVLGIATDITDRKTAEIILQKINEELEIRVNSRTIQLRNINHELRREIVERVRADSALRESEERFRQLVEQAADGFLLHDLQGRFIAVNQRACDSLNYSREELLSLTVTDIEENFDFEKATELWKQMIPGIPITLNGVYKRKDGTTFPVEASVGVFELDGSRLILALVRDITERQRAETEIRNAFEKEKQLNELKSRFITIASHEFRTPLTTILAAAESLEHYSHRWNEEKKVSYLHRIQDGVKRMTELLNDVLIVAKADAGKVEFEPKVINLIQFCQELTEEMQLADGNQHQIIFVNDGNFPDKTLAKKFAYMDEKLLRQIFTNLLSNAMKYSPCGSTIYFELSYQDENAVFQVQDQGIGIPPEDTELLFDAFHRAKNVGTISGTGLGLAIVKNAVDIHGGSITASSDVGVGTTFIVMLPLNHQI